MNNILGCIFDLDGVIVDTAKYHYISWKRVANQLGFDFTEKDNEGLKGVSRKESLEMLLKIGNLNLSEKEKQILSDKKNNWYMEYIDQLTEKEILPGAIEFIELLIKSNIKTALASGSKNARAVLNSINALNYFDTIIDGTMITNTKPNPEIFLKASSRLKLHPENCVVFEDAPSGIMAAKNAGMLTVGVGKKEVLFHADKVIENFKNQNISLIEF